MNDIKSYNNDNNSSDKWINKSNWWKWIFGLIIFVISPLYLALKPGDYTPIVQILFSLFLFLMAYWIGYTKENENATKQASDKWLPQAESVIYRLLTLHNNVSRFANTSKESCEKTKKDLPELEKDEMKAIKIKFQTDCDATSQRLKDIAFQIEDAIKDWSRFIEANCCGEECERISTAIKERSSQLAQDIKEKESNQPNITNFPRTILD